jgi:hypothetical protein
MITYATDLPFPANDNHDFVELKAPNPNFPSHYVSRSGRYFPNYEGRVFVPDSDVPEILADGCVLPDNSDYLPASHRQPESQAPQPRQPFQYVPIDQLTSTPQPRRQNQVDKVVEPNPADAPQTPPATEDTPAS